MDRHLSHRLGEMVAFSRVVQFYVERSSGSDAPSESARHLEHAQRYRALLEQRSPASTGHAEGRRLLDAIAALLGAPEAAHLAVIAELNEARKRLELALDSSLASTLILGRESP